MIIESIDQADNLFKVQNALPEELVSRISNIDWINMPWEKQPGQHHWPRRRILVPELTSAIDQHLKRCIPDISLAVGKQLDDIIVNTIFWLDEPGLKIVPHVDVKSVRVSMQLYWTEDNSDLGTTFFNSRKTTDIRYKCPYRINSGYLMLNAPGQYHGVVGELLSGYRVSSYTYFDYLA